MINSDYDVSDECILYHLVEYIGKACELLNDYENQSNFSKKKIQEDLNKLLDKLDYDFDLNKVVERINEYENIWPYNPNTQLKYNKVTVEGSTKIQRVLQYYDWPIDIDIQDQENPIANFKTLALNNSDFIKSFASYYVFKLATADAIKIKKQETETTNKQNEQENPTESNAQNETIIKSDKTIEINRNYKWLATNNEPDDKEKIIANMIAYREMRESAENLAELPVEIKTLINDTMEASSAVNAYMHQLEQKYHTFSYIPKTNNFNVSYLMLFEDTAPNSEEFQICQQRCEQLNQMLAILQKNNLRFDLSNVVTALNEKDPNANFKHEIISKNTLDSHGCNITICTMRKKLFAFGKEYEVAMLETENTNKSEIAKFMANNMIDLNECLLNSNAWNWPEIEYNTLALLFCKDEYDGKDYITLQNAIIEEITNQFIQSHDNALKREQRRIINNLIRANAQEANAQKHYKDIINRITTTALALGMDPNTLEAIKRN